MSELFLILLPILIADIINPILLAGVLFCLGSHRPIINTSYMILSFFVSYFLAGILITVGLEIISEEFHFPLIYDYILEFFIALLLIYAAWKQYRSGNPHHEKKLKTKNSISLLSACQMGLSINLIGLPLAIPYLAAIDQILKADIPPTPSILLLLLYNVLYVLPYAALIGLKYIYKDESDKILLQINQGMQYICDKLLPPIFFLLALLLLEDCLSYFLGYREYSFLSLTQTKKMVSVLF